MLYEKIKEASVYTEAGLLRYGFVKQADTYVYEHPLSADELFCRITIRQSEIHVDVCEREDGEKFLPFYVKSSHSGYVNKLKEEIANLVEQLKQHCFEMHNHRQAIIDEMTVLFHTPAEYPWEKETHCVLRTKQKHKWYALFMRIPYQRLLPDQEGMADIVNLKADPKVIQELIDNIHYFPAYHMNKTYWLSVLLDSSADMGKIKALLMESYRLAEAK